MRVLVIEDDEAIADAIVDLLRDAGHAARHVPDGRRALEDLRGEHERPCVILLDLMMPVMNGYWFREEQAKDASLADIPVVVCTADTRAEDRALAIGAAGWLRKPLDPASLLDVVGRFCPRASC